MKLFVITGEDRYVLASSPNDDLRGGVEAEAPKDFDFARQHCCRLEDGALVFDPEREAELAREAAAWEAKGELEETRQTRVNALVLETLAPMLTDEQALKVADADWPQWAASTRLDEGSIIRHGNGLYRVMQTVTAQEHQPPDAEGMLAVYRPIVQGRAGTLEDPIPFVVGMDVNTSLHYSYEGVVYLAKGDMKPCHEAWVPGTPGVHQWEVVG